MNEFFDDLARRWVAAAGRRGAAIAPPGLDAGVAAELLELARVAAHSKERRFAPLVAYTAGIAVERLRSGGAAADPAAVAAFVREVRQELESLSPPE